MTHVVVAEFPTAEAVKSAAHSAAERGHKPHDALTPFPMPELWELLTYRPKRPVGWVMVGAGAVAAAAASVMQTYSATVDYPFISGSRPFNSWQIFFLVMFETCILFACIAGFIAFIRDCRLPALYHPLFDVNALERATQDRFFLVFEASEADRHAVSAFVPQLNPISIHEVAL